MVTPLPAQPDIDPLLQPRRQVWSDYWRQGALHSLCGSVASGLDGGIRDFWLQAFSAAPQQGRLLDVCTGNGVIPRLACESASGRFARVDAIDLATLAPGWLAAAPEACRQATFFHGGIPAETLPFGPATFDLVTSQFGLEYCRTDLAVPELARVAKPGAGLALLLHHADSRLADVAREEAGSIQWLRSADGPLAAAAAIYPYLSMAASGQRDRLTADPQAAPARDQLNAAMHALVQRSERSAYPDLLFEARDLVAAHIQAIMQRSLTAARATAALDAWAAGLDAAAFRHRELCGHALDASAAALLAEAFSNVGFDDLALQPLHHEAHLMGWCMTGTRRA
jgi:SAM-dependent methyltransferase